MLFWIFILLIGTFVLLFSWFLFAPFIIQVDTYRQTYSFNILYLFSFLIFHKQESQYFYRVSFFSIPLKSNPLQQSQKEKVKPKGKKKKTKNKAKKAGKVGFKLFKRARRVIKEFLFSFKIRKMEVSIDTDDVIYNAWLVPVFVGINRPGIDLKINYEGKNGVVLDVRNRFFNLAYYAIKMFWQYQLLKSKK